MVLDNLRVRFPGTGAGVTDVWQRSGPGQTTTPTGETYTVQSDSTALLGNVKLSYVSIDTMQGPRPAIRIDADRVVLDNLRVRFPGTGAGVTDVWQRSGPGQTTT
ncbi:tripartite tricarboxylate transporter TctB family protein, partial [Corynebacterium bovis]